MGPESIGASDVRASAGGGDGPHPGVELGAGAAYPAWIAPETPRADADLARLEIPELLWLLGLGAAPAAFAEIDPWYGAAGLALGWAILLFGWARSFPWLARLEAAAEREHGPG